MPELTLAIAAILEEANLDYVRQDSTDGTTFALSMQGEHCLFDTWVAIYEDTQRVMVVSNHANHAPIERVSDVVEYLMRVNAGLILGSFDYDYDSRAIRFRTAVDVERVSHDEALTALFKNMFFTNLITADRYFHGLAKVLGPGITPAAAVALIREAH